MSARVLQPTALTEVGRGLGVTVGRPLPSHAALVRVRRNLFGPADHAAAHALADRELRAQAALDAERWGFDFRLEAPSGDLTRSRFEWQLLTKRDLVPGPYALRSMPYLHGRPGQPRFKELPEEQSPPPREVAILQRKQASITGEYACLFFLPMGPDTNTYYRSRMTPSGPFSYKKNRKSENVKTTYKWANQRRV